MVYGNNHVLGDALKEGLDTIFTHSFIWKIIFVKFWKKLVVSVGIICRILCIGKGQYPTFQIIWCGGFYVEKPRDDFPKSGKYPRVDWE